MAESLISDYTLDAVRSRVSTHAVAELAGLTMRREATGKHRVLCVFHEEKTPSAMVYEDPERGGYCFGCNTGFDAIKLYREIHGADFKQAVEALAPLAGVNVDVQEDAPHRPPRPQLAKRPSRPGPVLTRPPASEMRALWDASLPVNLDAAAPARDLLRDARCLDPEAIAVQDSCRYVPDGVHVPHWAQHWVPHGARLIFKTHGPAGSWESLRARVPAEGAKIKSLSTKGEGAATGHVYANATARWLLREGFGSWNGDGDQGGQLRVVIAEGEPDWLGWVQRGIRNETDARGNAVATAIFGVWGAAWTDAIAARIPDGVRGLPVKVVLRCDTDTAGDRYAATIQASLSGRKHMVFKRKQKVIA